MKPFDYYMFVLYVLVVALTMYFFFNFWGLATISLLIIVIIILQKIYFENRFSEAERMRAKMIDLVSAKMELFSKRLEDLKDNIYRNSLFLDNKMNEYRTESKTEGENMFREIAKKIFDIENRLERIRKIVGVSYENLDERIQHIEKEEQ